MRIASLFGMDFDVSVPIRGLFNLTYLRWVVEQSKFSADVSVPIRGLFNLTMEDDEVLLIFVRSCFRPHQGII